MKIKIKDNMNKYKITMKHIDILIFIKALEEFDVSKEMLGNINENTFDRYEFKTIEDFNIYKNKTLKKLKNSIQDVNVW